MSEPSGFDVVIVGAGHAGAQAAISLRQEGFEGSIALIGAEAEPPYERPPLSKEYLAGEKPFERMLMRPEKFWAERDITLMLSTRVTRISAMAREVEITGGRNLSYGKLIWAGGGAPRILDCHGSHAFNLFSVRSRRDVDGITQMLDTAENIAIIGGGYIGLEAAAVFRKLGKQVTIVEALDRVLSRVAGETLSAFYQQQHDAHGVQIRTGTKVEKIITGEDGLATSLVCDRGDAVPCDLVISGIGIIPATGPLIAEGASGGDGVDVDEFCRTSLPDIYAIGDCAAHTNSFADGRSIRLESVQNATDQAKTAAAHIMGEEKPYNAIPWFWSNQYDLKLQTVGLLSGYDEEVVRGDPDSGSFSVAYLRGGRLIAMDCVNATKDYVQARKRILEGKPLDRGQLADTSVALKEVELA